MSNESNLPHQSVPFVLGQLEQPLAPAGALTRHSSIINSESSGVLLLFQNRQNRHSLKVLRLSLIGCYVLKGCLRGDAVHGSRQLLPAFNVGRVLAPEVTTRHVHAHAGMTIDGAPEFHALRFYGVAYVHSGL